MKQNDERKEKKLNNDCMKVDENVEKNMRTQINSI